MNDDKKTYSFVTNPRRLFTCRQEAREIIKNGVNASEDDAVIFAGQGCTGAIRKLISALDLKDPPIVFTSTSEHQDNLQIWEEIGAKVSVID
ncbi:hypothetical protein QE152_g6377 [Popillia japonica]|uniref:SRP54-type proteins GTP-binding domain-containing protein n=1 Tax=Popillia japonica TaxID=7064 RepID=A0AAW1MIW9_POPJA